MMSVSASAPPFIGANATSAPGEGSTENSGAQTRQRSTPAVAANVREVTHNEISAAETARQYGADGGGAEPGAPTKPADWKYRGYPEAFCLAAVERLNAYIAEHGAYGALGIVSREIGVKTDTLARWRGPSGQPMKPRAKVHTPAGTLLPPGSKARNCLCCAVEFASTGAGHRMCARCRDRSGSPYEPDPGGQTGRQKQARRS